MGKELLTFVAIAAIVALLACIKYLIDASKREDKLVDDELANTALKWAIDAAEKAVVYVEQNFVEKIKDNPNLIWDKGAQKEALNQAMEKVNETLSYKTKNILSDYLGGNSEFGNFIKESIEVANKKINSK